MHLLIAAAGSGSRMGAGMNKVLLPLLGQPILAWTLAAAHQSQAISWVGLITSEASYAACAELLTNVTLRFPVQLILGGASRQESVARGLAALPADSTLVLIHDGARCLVSPALLDRCAAALTGQKGIIAAIPVKDTIKQVDPESHQILNTPPREQLWAAQTPQGFEVALLRQAHAHALVENWSVTDDAALFERLGWPVTVVPGEESNLKITTPLDLALAEFILSSRR